MTTDDGADPFRKSLKPQPRKPWEKRLLIANIKAHLEELEALLPPDEPDELDEDSADEEPDSAEFKAYMKRLNALRKELKGLKRK